MLFKWVNSASLYPAVAGMEAAAAINLGVGTSLSGDELSLSRICCDALLEALNH
jgi:hypothetical protein